MRNKKRILYQVKEANGAIVSSSLKEGLSDEKEINIKPYKARINKVEVKKLMGVLHS